MLSCPLIIICCLTALKGQYRDVFFDKSLDGFDVVVKLAIGSAYVMLIYKHMYTLKSYICLHF